MQMDLFVTDDLRLLMGREEKWCVSIFMPSHRVTTRVQEDQIRFKNLVREAEAKLNQLGPEGENLSMGPAYKLLEEQPFWQHQSEGLAAFIARDFFQPYRLPIRFDELVMVTNRFHTKPILPLLTGGGKFYLLALSQNEVRLFLCTKYSVSEVGLEGVPRSLEEALKYDELEKPTQFAPHTPGGLGKPGAMFHGHGVGVEDAKNRILRFFQEVDKGLERTLAQESAPMVVAAVDYLVPIFKEASTYPRVLEQNISGNPQGMSPEELHRKAIDIVAPHLDQEVQDCRAKFGHLSNTAKTASDVKEVVKAAYHGRVEALFVEVGVRSCGEYDSSQDEVKLLQQDAPGAGDLLDFAAAQTLLNGGAVYAVNHETMPDQAPVAAIFRY